MKTVLQIFRSDLRGVSRQFFAMVILIAICALPAMRECVAGMYGRSYAKCMGALALFTLGAIAFGLELYWPAKWLNRLINESKARSEIML